VPKVVQSNVAMVGLVPDPPPERVKGACTERPPSSSRRKDPSSPAGKPLEHRPRRGREPPLDAHDGDSEVVLAGGVAQQMTGARPAAVFVTGDIAHVVDPILDAPVPLNEHDDEFGGSLCSGARDQPWPGDATIGGDDMGATMWQCQRPFGTGGRAPTRRGCSARMTSLADTSG